MKMHKRTRLTPLDGQRCGFISKPPLGNQPLSQALQSQPPDHLQRHQTSPFQQFAPKDNSNQCCRTVPYGLKRLAKVELHIQERLKREAKHHNKSYPGGLVHFDTKHLPLLKEQTQNGNTTR